MAALSPEEVKAFIIETLEVSGASYRLVDEALLMAEVTVEIPPMFFAPARLEKQTLNLVFTPEDSANYPGAELVIPGSYRLNWFLDGLKERGNYTLQHFPYERTPAETEAALGVLCSELKPLFPLPTPKLQARPFLLVHYTLSYQTDELHEELVSLGLDMVNGAITPDFLHLLTEAEARPGAAGTAVETPGYSLEEAFTLLHRHLEQLVATKTGAGWMTPGPATRRSSPASTNITRRTSGILPSSAVTRWTFMISSVPGSWSAWSMWASCTCRCWCIPFRPRTAEAKQSCATCRCWARWKGPVPALRSGRGAARPSKAQPSRPAKSAVRATPQRRRDAPARPLRPG